MKSYSLIMQQLKHWIWQQHVSKDSVNISRC